VGNGAFLDSPPSSGILKRTVVFSDVGVGGNQYT
jgi:hypothetical protein